MSLFDLETFRFLKVTPSLLGGLKELECLVFKQICDLHCNVIPLLSSFSDSQLMSWNLNCEFTGATVLLVTIPIL